MTSPNHGLLFVVSEPKRTDHIREHAERYGEFTDTVSAPDIAPRSRDVALISLDGQTFAYAALATRGNRIATAKYVIRFSRLVALDALQASDLAAHVPGARFLDEHGRRTAHLLYLGQRMGCREAPSGQ